MNNEITPVNRNTGKLVAKNIIILVVLVTVCSLSIWAWFTQNSKAEAKGINVMAKAEGVEVSWDGKNYSYDLTGAPVTQPATDATTGETGTSSTDANSTTFTPVGPAYYYNDTLKLITGNGINFFEPTVNRRTGKVFKDGNAWVGNEITDENSAGKYIELDLYFRGTNESNVYLSGKSAALCNDRDETDETKKNTSEYGNFSKDYIGSAARVAFLDDNNTCKFIWPANYDHKLVGDSNSYQRIVKDDSDTEKCGYNIDDDLKNMLHLPDGNDYYIWLPNDYDTDTKEQMSDSSYYKMKFKVLDEETGKGLYVFDSADEDYDLTINIPSNRGSSMDILFSITTSTSGRNTDRVAFDYEKSYANAKEDSNSEIRFSDRDFVITDNEKYPKITYNGLSGEDDIRIVMGYNPNDNSDNYSNTGVILAYEWSSGSYDRIGYDTDNQKVIQYYHLDNNTSCALVSPKASAALSTTELYQKKSVKFSDNEQTKIESLYITFGEQFTAYRVNEIDELSNNEYKFKNNKSGTYVGISTDGTVTLQATETNAAKFKLTYDEDFNGPVLKTSEGFVLAIVNGDVTAVNTADNNVTFDVADAVTIFTGSSYEYKTDQSENPETYKYYNCKTKTEYTYSTDSYGYKYLTSLANDVPLYFKPNDANEVGVCIAELKKANESDPYYTAKITLRIWVEGTDNEAQTPLADGIFDLDLHFTTRFGTNNQ